MDNASRIKSLEIECQRLRRRMEQRPAIQKITSNVMEWVLEVDQGNTLETGQNGIKYAAGLTSVPSHYDPNAATSFVDGIGRGRLWRNGLVGSDYVLIVNADFGTFQNALLQGDKIYCSGSVSLQVGSGTDYVTAYIAG